MSASPHGPLRVGIGGPVGSGKTALVDRLCKRMRDRYDIAVVTNDIYTKEDAEFLTRTGALAPERIVGVETGGCPHTAIREDASINLAAVAEICRALSATSTWSSSKAAATISPRPSAPSSPTSRSTSSTSPPATRSRARAGPASRGPTCWSSTRSISRRWSAPSLEVMDRDARKMRGERPFLFTNLKENQGVAEIAALHRRSRRAGAMIGMSRIVGIFLAHHACSRARPAPETPEEWVALGARVHGFFGGFIPAGIRVGLDALERLKAKPRTLYRQVLEGREGRVPVHARRRHARHQRQPGQGTVAIAPDPAPAGIYAVIVIRDRKTGEGVKYTVAEEWQWKMIGWNKEEPLARYDDAMKADGLFTAEPAPSGK